MADCLICIKHGDRSQDARLVYADEHWKIYHSAETNILGYFFVESRRHILDLAQANSAEVAAYGPLLQQLIKIIKRVTQCERVYTISLGEAVPHCHCHVIPRRAELPKAFRGRGIMSYPTSPRADEALVIEVCNRTRRALARTPALI